MVASFFRVSTRPEDTFVAGLSMGGYGALRWALKQPKRLGAAVSLSGAVNVAGLRTGRVRAEDPRLFDRVFGSEEVAGSAHDLFALLDRTPRPSCRRCTCAAGPKIRSTPTTGPSRPPVPEPVCR